MSGENGKHNGKNGRHANGNNGRDPVTGKFLKGNPGGPGQPPKPLGPTWRKMIREVAKRRGVSYRQLVIDVVDKLVELAMLGDRQAIESIIGREIGPLLKEAVNVHVQQSMGITEEPGLPEGESLERWKKAAQVIRESGLLPSPEDLDGENGKQ
jgi:hypothetical protein